MFYRLFKDSQSCYEEKPFLRLHAAAAADDNDDDNNNTYWHISETIINQELKERRKCACSDQER